MIEDTRTLHVEGNGDRMTRRFRVTYGYLEPPVKSYFFVCNKINLLITILNNLNVIYHTILKLENKYLYIGF